MKSDPIEHRLTPSSSGTTAPAELCYFEWGQAQPNQPSWLFCHATGFHARCWDQVIACLPEDSHAIAVDMRGHGRSAKLAPYNWQSFGDDTCGLIEALDLYNLIGVGHSMGGHAVTQAAARLAQRFRRLVLVDPVIFDPNMLGESSADGFSDASEHPVARRKAEFDSWQAMFERFADRAPYSLWRKDVLEDYCRYGVVPGADGHSMTLACPPIVEASVYMGSTQYDLRPLLDAIKLPVAVLRARQRDPNAEGMDFSSSPTWTGLAAAMPDGVDVHLPELTHFIAMQVPELVAHCALNHVGGRADVEAFLA